MHERLAPDVQSALHSLFRERELPVRDAHRKQFTVVAPIEELLAWGFFQLAFEVGNQVVAIEVALEGPAIGGVPLLGFLDDVRFAVETRTATALRVEPP
jgi:hypothetical protein